MPTRRPDGVVFCAHVERSSPGPNHSAGRNSRARASQRRAPLSTSCKNVRTLRGGPADLCNSVAKSYAGNSGRMRKRAGSAGTPCSASCSRASRTHRMKVVPETLGSAAIDSSLPRMAYQSSPRDIRRMKAARVREGRPHPSILSISAESARSHRRSRSRIDLYLSNPDNSSSSHVLLLSADSRASLTTPCATPRSASKCSTRRSRASSSGLAASRITPVHCPAE